MNYGVLQGPDNVTNHGEETNCMADNRINEHGGNQKANVISPTTNNNRNRNISEFIREPAELRNTIAEMTPDSKAGSPD